MISSEVQRTLVKSPPELWAELSDAEALARHLGELGEIRITRLEPEQSVEWEAEDARGRIELTPSGWGTKVALQISRELPRETPAPESEAAQPEPVEPERPEVEPEPAEPESPPRPGLLARLFKRRAKPAPSPDPGRPAEVVGPAAAAAAAGQPEEPDLATQTEEMLGAVLDSLGAAHHRPFSRA